MLATEVTAGTPANTVATPVPVAVALFDKVSVDVPAPETTVVPDGKFALVIPTLPPPTRPPALTMSAGKLPEARVILSDPEVVFTGRLAAQELPGAGLPVSRGHDGRLRGLVSVRRGNPKTVLIVVVSSESKFRPVVLSRPLEKLVLPSQTQFRKPPVDARTVFVL